jgi:hypothetical protein
MKREIIRKIDIIFIELVILFSIIFIVTFILNKLFNVNLDMSFYGIVNVFIPLAIFLIFIEIIRGMFKQN